MKKEPCVKCSYESEDNRTKFGLSFCKVCLVFAPNNPEELDDYAQEKISQEELKPFRQYAKHIGEPQKKAMIEKAINGEIMSRPAFGYRFENKKIILSENYREVEEIFEDFLNTNISLRKLAKKHNLSVNGLKKILTNFTYVGKVKFNGQIHKGNHQPIISSTLFNHVQNKLEKLGIKKI